MLANQLYEGVCCKTSESQLSFTHLASNQRAQSRERMLLLLLPLGLALFGLPALWEECSGP